MITVTVLNRSTGRPEKGRKVTVHWRWSWTEGYTDQNGSVNLSGGPGEGTIYVSGNRVRKGQLSGLVTVYL